MRSLSFFFKLIFVLSSNSHCLTDIVTLFTVCLKKNIVQTKPNKANSCAFHTFNRYTYAHSKSIMPLMVPPVPATALHHLKLFITIANSAGGDSANRTTTATTTKTIRRISAPTNTTLDAFKGLVEEKLLSRPRGTTQIHIQYTDSEGDVVEVGSEVEWEEAKLQALMLSVKAIAASAAAATAAPHHHEGHCCALPPTLAFMIDATLLSLPRSHAATAAVCGGCITNEPDLSASAVAQPLPSPHTAAAVNTMMSGDGHVQQHDAAGESDASSSSSAPLPLSAPSYTTMQGWVVLPKDEEPAKAAANPSIGPNADEGEGGDMQRDLTIEKAESFATSTNADTIPPPAHQQDAAVAVVGDNSDANDEDFVELNTNGSPASMQSLAAPTAAPHAVDGDSQIASDAAAAAAADVTNRPTGNDNEEEDDPTTNAAAVPFSDSGTDTDGEEEDKRTTADASKGVAAAPFSTANSDEGQGEEKKKREAEEEEEEAFAKMVDYDGHPLVIRVHQYGADLSAAEGTGNGDATANAASPQTLTDRQSQWPAFPSEDRPMIDLLSKLLDCCAEKELLDPLRQFNFGSVLRRTLVPYRYPNSGAVDGCLVIEIYRDEVRRMASIVATRSLVRMTGSILASPCGIQSRVSSRTAGRSMAAVAVAGGGGGDEEGFASASLFARELKEAQATVALLKAVADVFPRDATMRYHLACGLAIEGCCASYEGEGLVRGSGRGAEASAERVVLALKEAMALGLIDLQQVLDEPIFNALPFAVSDSRPFKVLRETDTFKAFLETQIGLMVNASGGRSLPATAVADTEAGRKILKLLAMFPALTLAEGCPLLAQHGFNLHACVTAQVDAAV